MRSEKCVVLLKHRYIGDAIMATPLLRAVHTEFSEVQIIAAPHLAQLFHRESYAPQVVPYGEVKGIRGFLKQVRALRKHKFDVAILVNRSARSALIARAARIPIRVGHDTDGRSALLTNPVPYDKVKFEAICYGDLGRAVGVECNDLVGLTEAGLTRNSNRVAIQPGCNVFKRTPRPEHFAILARELRRRGKEIVLIGAKSEVEYAETFVKTYEGPVENLVGQCTLPETMEVIEGLGQMFSGDTGLVHICAALGTPTVSVFACSPESKWGHQYEPHTVIPVGNVDITMLDPARLIEAIR